MKKSPSFIYRVANPTLKGSQLILYASSCITQILKSSRGRYKIFGIIQYLAGLYKDCMLDYLQSYRIKEWPRNVKNSKMIQDSMKNGRKVFRLLRWIEEIGSIHKNLRKNTTILQSLNSLRHLIGIFYYFFDNVVWISEAGVINKYISDPSWKWDYGKNILSLMRYCLLLFITLLKAQKILSKEKKNSDILLKKKIEIIKGNEGYDLMLNLFKIRYKRRYSMLSLMKNLLRIVMLYKVIKLPGSNKISTIFCLICGIFSYALGVAKLLAVQYTPHTNKRRMTQSPSSDSIFKI
jgi:Peroxisomal biogenesis factor 11 (PEX11)